MQHFVTAHDRRPSSELCSRRIEGNNSGEGLGVEMSDDSGLTVSECVKELQLSYQTVCKMTEVEKVEYLCTYHLPTGLACLTAWPNQPGTQTKAAAFISMVGDVLASGHTCHPSTQQGAFLFVKNLLDIKLVQPSFV